MKDPDFLADAEKMQADVSPVTAAEIDELLAEVYATPKDDHRQGREGDRELIGAWHRLAPARALE